MPNQLAVIRSLRQDVIGPQHHYMFGEIATMPSDAYDDVTDAMAAILERVAVAVDWPRLLVEASWRHMTLHPDRKEERLRYQSEAAGVCGECIAEALLQENTGAPDWEREPDAELRHQAVDWAAIVHNTLQHRRGTIRHEYRTPHRGRTDETQSTQPPRRVLTPGEHDRAWHAIEGAAGEPGADPDTILNAVLAALRIQAPSAEDEQAAREELHSRLGVRDGAQRGQ
ncbi:hypothetical protein SEA_GILGAMESH_110 [Streptomyces phage Gilgamesh]|uniref:Uncharacterized protein n=1 Tax=Streptomyces phage Gilgamesh TaxID=2599890 RepID=A0A5J6TXU4_9CAUD|nr:hypothetical protein QEH35_gp110 [Streptomyces phage Gilgamesh]QFG13302.1 hypothetical protein SEA_GILGAMESH_110 [Streptomyces phage Gilgamesh]